jgi:hypothetical protein
MTRKLEKAQWRPFLDTLSKLLEAKEAEIEVASLDLGDQVQAEWLPHDLKCSNYRDAAAQLREWRVVPPRRPLLRRLPRPLA